MISKKFTTDILAWYDKNKRDLPWRHTRDPYFIWVSEMMLQQTTVATVISYYSNWIKQFPTVFDLAKASSQDVLRAWQGLGYYNRARNFHQAAKIVVENYKGKLPKDSQCVRALPGFGPYATAAVLSIAFDLPLTLVDANVRRVLMRVLCIEGFANPKIDDDLHVQLAGILPKRSGDFNQSLMELGATVCKSKIPLCSACPIKAHCQAFKLNKQLTIPQVKSKIIQHVNAAIGIIKKSDKYFIQQRSQVGLLAELWEFPGGKIEPGETPQQAVIRELKEEVGVEIVKVKFLTKVSHFYTQFKVNLSVWECEPKRFPRLNARRKWATRRELDTYPMPSGSVKILKFLN